MTARLRHGIFTSISRQPPQPAGQTGLAGANLKKIVTPARAGSIIYMYFVIFLISTNDILSSIAMQAFAGSRYRIDIDSYCGGGIAAQHTAVVCAESRFII